RAKTILVVWVKDFIDSGGVQGVAYHEHRLLPGVRINTKLMPTAPSYSVIFISSKAKMSSMQNPPHPLAHEIGHVLWADAGSGKEFYNSPDDKFGAKNKKKFRSNIEDLFIKRMGLGIPAADVEGLLEGKDHHHLGSNLMNATPDNTGVPPTGLTFVQVGLFRLASELMWSGE